MSLAYSEALKQNKFLRPPSDKSTTQRENAQDSDSDWDSRSASPIKIVRFQEPSQKKKPRRRQANLYDAVAGRVTARGFVPNTQPSSKTNNANAGFMGSRVRRPEELLLREDHPMRQAERGEPYFAHENLPADCPLPNSDLLQSIHAYTADFYHYNLGESGRKSHYSMNESALLAMGILAEELAKEGLGENGDLTMIEPRGKKDEISVNPADYLVRRGRPIGWRANLHKKTTKDHPRRNRSGGNTKRRSKRPRLEDVVGAKRANKFNKSHGLDR